MTEPATRAEGGLPSPAAALERRFTHILRTRMDGVPMVNAALGVRAVGFREWGANWLGVLVTPWFMNLVLMPRLAGQWQAVGERQTRHFVFPAGVFEFIGAHDAELGGYLACSLFSPMQGFADMAGAEATAAAAIDALFDEAHRDPEQADVAAGTPIAGLAAADGSPAPAQVAPAPPPSAREPAPALSKRAFLFGTPRRPGDGP